MAITNGATLATAVANWMQRTDLTSRIPEFVALAEAKIFRELRTPDMETKDAAFSITGEFVAVPTGFLEARSFMLNTTPRRAITFMPDDTQARSYNTGSGCPIFFDVVGSNFRFAPVPDATYSATLVYYVAPSTVSTGSTEQNWLLTAAPDVYLYGALAEAAAYAQDNESAAKWSQAFSSALSAVKKQGSQKRWGGNGMTVRAA